MEQLRGSSLELDAQLENPLQKTAAQMQRALETFSGRAVAAAARRDEVAKGRLEKLRGFCIPEGRLQERVIASSHFPGKYGEGFVAAMFEQMSLDPTNLQIVSP